MQDDFMRRALSGVGVQKCIYCGEPHETVCPKIKAIDYDEHGDVRRVELMTPADYPLQICRPGEIKFFEGR